MINVGRVLLNPKFLVEITRSRPTVTLGHGGVATRTYSDTIFKANVQPAGVDAIKMLPEGIRLDNVIVLYSRDEIATADAKSTESDLVQWNGGWYRVFKVRHWEAYGYYETFAEGVLPGAVPA